MSMVSMFDFDEIGVRFTIGLVIINLNDYEEIDAVIT